MPSDDDFVHNYMVCVYQTSLQQKTGTSSKFQQIKHFVKVKLKPYHTHAVYMHAYVNTGADVNLMPQDMYIKLYNDDKLKHLKPSDIKLGVWGDDQIALLGKCNIYLVYPDTKKKPVKVTFYVADKSGSTLLSCATSLKLDLIKLHPRLGVPPPRAKIITRPGRSSFTCSQEDHPRQGSIWWVAEYCARTIGHRKMSQVSKWSAQWDEFIGTKISSIWLFKMCRMAKMFDCSAPPFNHWL